MTISIYFKKWGPFCNRKRTCEEKEFILMNCEFYFEKFNHFSKNGVFFVECEEEIEQVERCIENIAINAPWLSSAGWRIYTGDELISKIIVMESEIKNYNERRFSRKDQRDADGALEDAERDGED